MNHEKHFEHTDLTPASDPEQLALDILQFARNRLLIRLRFLEPAFLQLSLAPDPEGSFATDGYFISYSFVHVIRRFQAAQENVSFDYLHVVMHCLFGHPFVGPAIDRIVWDTATDIAVCAAILALKLPYLKTDREERQTELIEALQADVPLLTAERLYHFFREIHCEPERLLTMRELFACDDHAQWYTHAKTSTQEEAEKEPDPEKTEDSENSSEEDASGQNDPGADDEGETAPAGGGESASVREDGDVSFEEANALAPSADETSAVWRDISGKVQTDLETTSGEYGQKASSILRALKEVNRERYDYGEFLRQFCVPSEVLKTSEEEFDYIYYTYGLNLYENVPLIEPLEYSDQKRIRDFVIVIDTSASVDGDLVQLFLQKTWNILKSSETFHHTVNIHLLQCDAEVQSDTLLTSQEAFDAFLADFQLKGFGGTDFRPAFAYVDRLVEDGAFQELSGVIYFTDGDGAYPEYEPEYRTAFVFLEDHYTDRDVPVWAIKQVLETKDFEDEQF